MKNPIKSVFLQLAMALPMCWSLSAPAAAQEVAASAHVPLESMTRTEYENYRRQLGQQMNGAIEEPAEQDAAAAEKASGQPEEKASEAKEEKEAQSRNSGYGKGYRARMEHGGRSARAGAGRGGSMSRGGGRNR